MHTLCLHTCIKYISKHIYPSRTHNSHEQSITQLRAGAFIGVLQISLFFWIFFGVSAPDPRTSYANESCQAVMRGRYIHIYPSSTQNSHDFFFLIRHTVTCGHMHRRGTNFFVLNKCSFFLGICPFSQNKTSN